MRRKPEFSTTTPVALKQLFELKGAVETANLIGCSDTTLRKHLAANKTMLTMELAATIRLQEIGQPHQKPKERLLICKVPEDKIDTVRTILSSLGCRLREFVDE
jgi:hypothetical protein